MVTAARQHCPQRGGEAPWSSFLLEVAITSECNLNLLKKQNIF